MQELIERLDKTEKQLDKENNLIMSSALYAAKNMALELLEKEKEQILNAYQQGNGDAGWLEDKYEPQEYYNQTYNQEETLEEWKSKFTHHCAIKTNQNK